MDIERLTTYETSILDRLKFSLYKITAGFVRSIELNVVHDPIPENKAHALITGNITHGKAKQMAQRAEYVW